MSFGWTGRPRRVVVTAFGHDRRILQQWDLDLTVGQRVPVPQGTSVVWVEDAATITRARVELRRARRRRRARVDDKLQ